MFSLIVVLFCNPARSRFLSYLTRTVLPVGCISAVNAQVGARGFDTSSCALLPPLVMEERDKAKSREAVKETLGKPETELPQSKVDELSQSSGGSEEKSDSQLIEVYTITRECTLSSNIMHVMQQQCLFLLFLYIQLATFPGYSPEHCTPLPHGMSTLDQMRRITRAQKMLATKVHTSHQLPHSTGWLH